MSFKDCLDEAVRGKELKQSEADRLLERYKQLQRQAALKSRATADAEAKRLLEDELKASAAHQRRKAALAVAALGKIRDEVTAHGDVRGVIYLLSKFGGEAPFESVDGIAKEIVGRSLAELQIAFSHYGRDALGRWKARDTALDTGIARAVFGEASNPASKAVHDAFIAVAERLRQRFNAAGGAIGSLEGWFPQWHDSRALWNAGKAKWIADITPLLDLDRMKHPLTGTPILPEELPDILSGIWDNVVTDGAIDREPTLQRQGRGALANQRAEHRFLFFRDAEAFMTYNRAYGSGGLANAMFGHVSMMARDIAALERLGPNPGATVEYLKGWVRQEAAKKAVGQPSLFKSRARDPKNAAGGLVQRIDEVWGDLSGSIEAPVNSRLAGIFRGGRALVTASSMGSAILSSTTDVVTSFLARRHAAIGGGVLADMVYAATKMGREEAQAAWLILDSALHVNAEHARFAGPLQGPEVLRLFAAGTLRYSGLDGWTQAAKFGHGLAWMYQGARNASKAWDRLPAFYRARLSDAGFSAADWETMRQAGTYRSRRGLDMLRPNEIAKIDERLAERYLGMIQDDTLYAVPESTPRSRSIFLGGSRAGTLQGEFLRSGMQFRTFSATTIMLHGRRIMRMARGKEEGALAAYAAAFFIGSTLAGALSVQLKAIAAGRDPENMADPRFWGQALLQGGGLGIFGDFFFSDVSREGSGLATTLTGPLVDRFNNFRQLVVGDMLMLGGDLADQQQGKPVDWQKLRHRFGADALNFLQVNMPGSNIWYLRLAWQHELFDQLHYLADPEANAAFKRQQQYWRRSTGQEFWWQPGTAAPQRVPNLAAAAGG